MGQQFPLKEVSDTQLLHLGHTLWSWNLCGECLAGKYCKSEECPWQRSKILGRFFEFYKDLTAAYEPNVKHGRKAAIDTHTDLVLIIRELKLSPDITLSNLLKELFTDESDRSDQEFAVGLAVRVLTMVNCSASRQSPELLEHGMLQIPWRSDVAFSQYIQDVFPETDHPSISEIKENLRARKLIKSAGIEPPQAGSKKCGGEDIPSYGFLEGAVAAY